MISANAIVLALLVPFSAAPLAPLIRRKFSATTTSLLIALAPLSCFLLLTTYIIPISQGATYGYSIPWAPSYNVSLSFYLDGLSLIFALLISGIGALIVIFSGAYLKKHRSLGKFLCFILLFMTSMLGLVLADHLLTFFVFWELTSISSFLLIGFDHHRRDARRAALQALVVTGAGGLAMLAGLLLIIQITGQDHLSAIIQDTQTLRNSPLYAAVFWLIIIGAFTKSAQFPFHFWLPNAMEAPTPVSAYLHSATMVKAGVYLLLRLSPAMNDTQLWQQVLPIAGSLTLIIGMVLAIQSTKLKLILAYTTVASLGLLVLLIGLGGDGLILGALCYLIAHALFKGSLFMIAGCITHQTGANDIRHLGGLYSSMPVLMVATALSAASMAGLPLTFGFIAKEVIYQWLHAGQPELMIWAFIVIVANIMMFALAIEFLLKSFFLHKNSTPKIPREPPVLLSAGAIILALTGIAAFVIAYYVGEMIILPALNAVTGTINPAGTLELHSAITFNPALVLSLATIFLGVLLYLQIDSLRALFRLISNWLGWGPDRGFDQLVVMLIKFGYGLTTRIQSDNLHRYLLFTFIMVAAAILFPLISFGLIPDFSNLPALRPYDWPLIGLAILGLGAVVIAKTRLTAVASMGAQGFALALLFLLLGAPDLSFTQFMIETLSVVILALVLTRLELDVTDTRENKEIVINGMIALIIGTGVASLLAVIISYPLDHTLQQFYAITSYALAHGRNVVNVILVDYRALDTFGEITVVLIASISVFALINMRIKQKSSDGINALNRKTHNPMTKKRGNFPNLPKKGHD